MTLPADFAECFMGEIQMAMLLGWDWRSRLELAYWIAADANEEVNAVAWVSSVLA